LAPAYPSEIVKRDGRVVPFDPGKIESAIRRCLLAEHVEGVERLAREVTQAALHIIVAKHEAPTVEQVQDAVEVALLSVGMRGEARAYMAYRDERARMRADGAASTPRPVRQKPSGWGDFAHTIFSSRYSMGGAEAWEDTARRVARSVFRGLPATVHGRVAALSSAVERLIAARQFMPGGRYLYAAGRELHQVNNCLLCFVDDSREGWADHVHKHVMGLSTGAGMGTVYSRLRPKGARLRRTGGVASGPIPLMVATNELGRGLRQGGDRRSALWAGLHWWHRDAMDFVRVKDWTPEVRAMKAANWEFPAPMDGTNISVILDDEFFAAMADPEYKRTDPIHGEVTHQRAHDVFWAAVRGALREGDPGFSVDIGANAGESGRNACVTGDTEILTDSGYKRIDSCIGQRVSVWNGHEWSEVSPRVTGKNQRVLRVELSSGQSLTVTTYHEFAVQRVYGRQFSRVQAGDLRIGDKLAKFSMPVIRGGRSVPYAYSQGFISGDGMDGYGYAVVYGGKKVCIPRLHGKPGKDNAERDCVCVRFSFDPHPKDFVPQDWDLQSRLEWLAGLIDTDGTETAEGGCQIGSVNLEFLRRVQRMLTTIGTPSKISLMAEAGKRPMPDGNGGVKEYMCQDSYRLLICSVQIQNLKKLGMRCSRVQFDKFPQRDASRFVTVTGIHDAGVAHEVYCFTEPKRNLGCFNGVVTGQCTELTTHDDSDICNIGSLNLARFRTLDEFRAALRPAVAFLLAGTVYSDVPYAKVAEVRAKNRRLGLGLMGVHEWLLQRGRPYGPDAELEEWLAEYARSTEIAHEYADEWGISRPVKTRAMAPNGTIGIVAETTTCMEPLLTVAYKRLVKEGDRTWAQYVVDPVAERLIQSGIQPEAIETAYSLSETMAGVERRIAFQAWFQRYVDHGIASTINLAQWGSQTNCEATVEQFGKTLLRYLPYLRGITVYPDGARGGKPITQVPYHVAAASQGERVYETGDVCDLRGGSCGS
jgi:ribonucleotide reductase alpha subunit